MPYRLSPTKQVFFSQPSHYWKYGLVVLWFLLMDSVLQAEPPSTEDPPSTTRLQEIIISATRTSERLTSLPGHPTLLSREDIDASPFRGGHYVDDVLRYVPGIQPANLSSRFNHPTAQSISIRGLGIRRALVLLDGIPLNDGFGGWINWGLTPDTLDRIEVVPGGGSNLYGTWAMGGVIHLLSPTPPTRFTVQGISQAGNLDSYTQSVSTGYGTDRAGLRLGYRWFHTNGFVTLPDEQRGPLDRTNDSRHQLFNGEFHLAMTSRTNLRLRGIFFREDRTFGTSLSLASRTIGILSGHLEGRTPRGDQWEATLFSQWQTFRNQTSQIISSPTIRNGERLDRIQTIPSNDLGGTFQWTAPVGARHTFVVGWDTRFITGQSRENIFSNPGAIQHALGKGKQLGWGVFAEWIGSITDRLTVIPSIRSDWWKNFEGTIETPQGTTFFPRDNVETALNPKLALHYRINEALSTSLMGYQAFRAPTLNELYRDFSFSGFTFLSNSNLVPERLTGGETTLSLHVLPKERLRLRITAHYNEIRDQIVFVANGPLSVQRHNIGKTRTIGGEVDLTLRLGESVTAQVGYAYVDSTVLKFPGNEQLEGKQIPTVSRHHVTTRVTVGQPDLLQLTIMGRYLSKQFADSSNLQPVADFLILDMALQKQLTSRLRLFLNAENVTDRQYVATQTGPTKTVGAPLTILGGLHFFY